MPQLQINQGPQDALLYDNTRSYFTNVGYVRTSNFQMELRDVDSQNSASLGSTVQFVIPKAADLLGPVDLMVNFATASSGGAANTYAAWVEAVGLAMLERVTLSVGSHDIETVTGEQLHIINELMKSDEQRLGTHTVLKTGAPALYYHVDSDANNSWFPTGVNSRLIHYHDGASQQYPDGAKLIVPLGLFFTKHPSQYFPLAAIAGCNDIRISIKFRTLDELLVLSGSDYAVDAATDKLTAATQPSSAASKPVFTGGNAIDTCRLRCHYVHVTGPEATTLMNKEHVRLLKLWQLNTKTETIKHNTGTKNKLFSMDLSFLHPVQELIIVIRKTSEMGSGTGSDAAPKTEDQGAITKNYFAYHGGGSDPNVEALRSKMYKAESYLQTGYSDSYLTVDNFQLTLNGQERHPSLASTGLDRNYLMNRLMPMLHSNTSYTFHDIGDNVVAPDGADQDMHRLGELMDRKEIYVYPFSLNPEGANPSGAVNFSKVSHAKLTINGTATVSVAANQDTALEYRCDVYGVHYNWLQIKDGRALTSFA